MTVVHAVRYTSPAAARYRAGHTTTPRKDAP